MMLICEVDMRRKEVDEVNLDGTKSIQVKIDKEMIYDISQRDPN